MEAKMQKSTGIALTIKPPCPIDYRNNDKFMHWYKIVYDGNPMPDNIDDAIEIYEARCKQMFQRAEIPVLYENAEFDNFIPQNKLQEKILAHCRSHDGNIYLCGSVGTGKAMTLDSLIYTPTGVKTHASIKHGDEVCTPDGGTATVIGVFPQGLRPVYKITFSDNSQVECDSEHLWEVYDANRRETDIQEQLYLWKMFGKYEYNRRILSTEQLYHKVNTSTRGDELFRIETTQPVLFNKKSVEMHPYLMGVLLGDGSFTTMSLMVSSADAEILNQIKELIDYNYKLSKHNKYDYNICYKHTGTRPENKYIRILKNYNLHGCKSYEKFIPDDYIYNSIEVRLSLLQGLMDTDGTVGKRNGMAYFSTTSFKLMQGVSTIVESLGGIITYSTKIPTYTYKGKKKKGRLAYMCNIRLNNTKSLFRLSRKKDLARNRSKYKTKRTIRAIDYMGMKETCCILINHPKHLYLTNHFIPTHNTHMAIARLKEHLRDGRTGMFISTISFLEQLRPPYNDDNAIELTEKVRTIEILVLDDFGMQKDSDWTYEQLAQLINLRYMNKRVTIITSNIMIDNFEGIQGERIASRIKEVYDVIILKGDDYRDKIAHERIRNHQ